MGLVSSLGAGVRDFFYEPAQGLVKSPQDFGKGLAKGSASLLKHTVSGVFKSAGSLAASVEQGLAVMSFDDAFIKAHERRSAVEPRHAAEGFLLGAEGLSDGIFEGLAGLVLQPIDGAQKDGFWGGLRGMGKGLVGVVAKPVSGAVALASNTFKGIGNTAGYLTDDELVANAPVRYARVFLDDKVVAYDHKLAKKAWLQKIEAQGQDAKTAPSLPLSERYITTPTAAGKESIL
jgi:hypothetical protein